jgi:Fe-S-cluster-containing dehydrogenase component
VCPVYATYHAPDGLNVQVYNRCVGTRYCSNNCPYKVRYFNWFGFGESDRKQYAFPEPLNWQLNPDVTVRTKGVMEKCTFCVQRIREAENRAVVEGRELQPDEFTVACAQGCPSRAITFGDAADPNWAVAQLANDRRAYHVFEELNTFTAVVYLKKVNHPARARQRRAHRRRDHGNDCDSIADGSGRTSDGGGSLSGVKTTSRSTARSRERSDQASAGSPRWASRSCACSSARRRGHTRFMKASAPRAITAGDVGRVHHHLRVLGRYRPRGHAHLRDSVSVPRGIPHVDLSRVGSDDGVRRHDGRTLPDPALGPAVKFFLSDSVSELAAHLAESQEPARVGRVRDPHVPHDLEHLLYIGLIPDIAILRDREKNPIESDSRARCRWLANFGSRMRHFTRAYLFLGRLRDAARSLRCTRWLSFDFAMALTAGLATRRSSRRTSSRAAIFLGHRHGVHDRHSLRKAFKLEHYITLNDLDAAGEASASSRRASSVSRT